MNFKKTCESKGMLNTARADGEVKDEVVINASTIDFNDEVIIKLTALAVEEMIKLRK